MPEEPVLVAWDTCTAEGVVSVSRAGRTLSGSRFRTMKGHAGWLMPLIDSAVSSAGVTPAGIGAVAVGTGPGGYTGVKVGVSTAKAMALGLGVPLAGIPTLDFMAAHADGVQGPLLCCMDARRGLLFAAAYLAGEEVRRVTEFRCLDAEGAAGLLEGFDGVCATAVGHVPEEMSEALGRRGVDLRVLSAEEVGFPSPEKLAVLAAAAVARAPAGGAAGVLPIYLRKAV